MKENPSIITRTLVRMLACNDLPDQPPEDPMPLLRQWADDARDRGGYADWNAMTLATATRDGLPSARIVLCKAIEIEPPGVVLFTSYDSRKGLELAENPNAAAVFHWPHAGKQVRIEGAVVRTSLDENREYFRSRPLLSRIGAAASHQSGAICGRDELINAALSVAARAAVSGGHVDCPSSWGGFRLSIRRLELWSSREGRLHDRVRWERVVTRGQGRTDWNATRLGP